MRENNSNLYNPNRIQLNCFFSQGGISYGLFIDAQNLLAHKKEQLDVIQRPLLPIESNQSESVGLPFSAARIGVIAYSDLLNNKLKW